MSRTGPGPRGVRQPGADSVEEAVPLGLRVGAQRRRKGRDDVGELGHEPHQLPRIAAQAATKLVAGSVVDLVAQRLDERLIGHAKVLAARSGEHGGAPGVEAGGDLAGQAGLAHPGLAGDEGEAKLPGRRLLPLLLQPTELALPSDEDATHPPQQRRQRNRRNGQRLPGHPEDRHEPARAPLSRPHGRRLPADVLCHCPHGGLSHLLESTSIQSWALSGAPQRPRQRGRPPLGQGPGMVGRPWYIFARSLSNDMSYK